MDRPETDLEDCAREPIHIPGAIQPHGALVVLRPNDLSVLQASRNASEFFGSDIVPAGRPTGPLGTLLNRIKEWHEAGEPTLQAKLAETGLLINVHKSVGSIVIEAERAADENLDGLLSRLKGFAQTLAVQPDHVTSLTATAEFVLELTGFDRVLIYRFDEEWNGHVVGEAGNGKLPSYLDLRFPAGDIPAQARALYASNRSRLIPDAEYRPVPLEPQINPDSRQPLDLSHAQLRSVSPIHLEYMRNMGTAASMSVSIIVDGRLWGLVSCHSSRPHMVAPTIRDACEFVVQSLAMRIAAQIHAEDAASRVELARVSARLLASMTGGESWLQGLGHSPNDLLDQVRASGAAIVTEQGYLTFGVVPPNEDIGLIVNWLATRPNEEIFHTASLARELAEAERFAEVASGIIAIPLSKLHSNWLIWFRPEVVRTVQWGGNPHKLVREAGRIHPRKSFEAWREQVRRHSLPWSEAELGAARDLRNAIVGIVLRNAEELADLTGELQRSNRELEAFSYSVSHDLRAPFRHIVGFAQLLAEREGGLDEKSKHYLQNISESALAAGRLVDDLLNFSQLGRTTIVHKPVDMNKLVAEVVKSVMFNQEGRDIQWSIDLLPPALGDATLLRQVWFNLIENAVKYTRPRQPAIIRISGTSTTDENTYTVADNGVGFDMTYVNKLFGVFQRLQRAEDFEGTGIGLALVRRIVERHHGNVTATGEIDKGASFAFVLPGSRKKGRAFA